MAEKTAHGDDRRLERLVWWGRLMKRLFFSGFLLLPVVGVYVILITMADLVLPPEGLGILTVAMFGLIIIGGIGGSLVDRKMKKIAVAYTPTILARVMDRLDEYNHLRCIETEYIERADVGFPSYDRIGDCGDYVKGVLCGIPLAFSEFSLEEERIETDSDGDVSRSFETVFSGLMVVCRHDMTLREDFTVSQYVRYIGGIKTESEAFNKAFSINAADGHDAFYLLTPHYMETLLQLSEEYGEIFALRFCRDGTLLVVLKGWNLFEAGESKSVAALTEKIEKEMRALGDVLERLKVPARLTPAAETT